MPIIPAIWQEEIRKITFEDSPGKKKPQDPTWKITKAKVARGMAQAVERFLANTRP
jgi:hypothetical protein